MNDATPSNAGFAKARDIALILSAIAVPLLIAWIELREQRLDTEDNLKKDYVQIAVAVLQRSWPTKKTAKRLR